MRVLAGFVCGIVVGLAAGMGGLLNREPSPAPTPSKTGADSGPETVETLRAEIVDLREKLEAASRAPEAIAKAPNEGSATPPAESTKPEDPEEAAFRKALDEVRAELRSVRDAEPGSDAVLALIRSYRARTKGEDEMLARLAGRALVWLAGAGKLRPADVDNLAREFNELAPNSPGRAGLAATVARAWDRDARLATWFAGLPVTEEPDVRAAVVEALDESPSDAYREYLLRLTRTELDPDVLEAVWHEDPITVCMTTEFAPKLVAAVEARVGQGGLPPVVRGRAIFAIGLAGVHRADEAAAGVRRLLAAETDEGVGAYARAVLDAIAREEANVQVLDGLWAKHRRSFGEE